MPDYQREKSKNGSVQPNWLKRSWWQRLIGDLASTQLAGFFLFRYLHRLDRFVMRMSTGRYTATGLLTGLPVIWLKTIGAKSGQPRCTPLVALKDGEHWALIASSLGNSHNPAWYYNLKANPKVSVSLDHSTSAYIAREVYGKEREYWWQRAVDLYPGYARYKIHAGNRQIPIIILYPFGRQQDN